LFLPYSRPFKMSRQEVNPLGKKEERATKMSREEERGLIGLLSCLASFPSGPVSSEDDGRTFATGYADLSPLGLRKGLRCLSVPLRKGNGQIFVLLAYAFNPS